MLRSIETSRRSKSFRIFPIAMRSTIRPSTATMCFMKSQFGARKGQSKEKLAGAIKRLGTINSSMLRLDEGLKSDYLVAFAPAAGDSSAINGIGVYVTVGSELVRRGLLPWERGRATRLLNILMQVGLQRLSKMRSPAYRSLEAAGRLIDFCVPPGSHNTPLEFFETWDFGYPQRYVQGGDEKWLDTTIPDLRRIGVNGLNAANRLAWFKADRRATVIILAIEEYRLDHGQLPRSLDPLKGEYLDAVPADPYSGFPFVYFPKGIAVSPQEVDWYTAEMNSFTNYENDWWRGQFRSPPVVPGVPGLWSTGATVRASSYPRTDVDADLIEKGGKGDLISRYHPREGLGYIYNSDPVWLNGDWFGIPDKQ